LSQAVAANYFKNKFDRFQHGQFAAVKLPCPLQRRIFLNHSLRISLGGKFAIRVHVEMRGEVVTKLGSLHYASTWPPFRRVPVPSR